VVGGHGPPGGPGELRTMREHWLWLRDEVAGAEGESLGDLAERLIRSPGWTESAWADWAYPERTVVNVARIAATSGPEPKSLSTLERIRLIAEMGALAERLNA